MKKFRDKSSWNAFVCDWGEYIKENNIQVYFRQDGCVDVKIVNPNNINRKECSRLNRELGINGINLEGNVNGVKKNK